MNGLEVSVIQNTMLSQAGLEQEELSLLIQEVQQSPSFKAGLRIVQERRKLEWLLRVYHHSYNQSAFANSIERRSMVTEEEFIEHYYSVNRPVILTEPMKHWEILESWNWERIAQKFGTETIEVEHSKNKAGQREHVMDKMAVSQFISLIQEPECPTDLYMTAYNARNNRNLLDQLLAELPLLPPFLDSQAPKEQMMLWIGPKGTMGRFHMDLANSVLAQVKGCKEIRMAPSFSLPYVYHEFATVSSLNLDDWDLQRNPMFQYVPVIPTILQPGEMLFIPIGWWHQVRSLEPSISITFTNFKVDNQYFSTEEIYSPQPK